MEYSHLYVYKRRRNTFYSRLTSGYFDGYASYALLKDMLYQEIQLPAKRRTKRRIPSPKESPYYKWGGILKSN